MFYKANNQNYKEIIQEVNKEACLNGRRLAFYIKTVEDWMEEYSGTNVLGVGINKNDDILIAVERNRTIYLLSDIYNTIMFAPRLMFHLKEVDHAHIDDVLMKTNNIGNGAIAMKALFAYCEDNYICVITGDLSSVDNDHKNRRDHYYASHGFEVNPNKIVKRLEKDT